MLKTREIFRVPAIYQAMVWRALDIDGEEGAGRDVLLIPATRACAERAGV